MTDKLEYEIKLTIREQRLVLMEVARALQAGLKGIQRKRTWRDSEKAMAAYTTTKRLVAVNMAIDALTDNVDAEIKAAEAPKTKTVDELMAHDGLTPPTTGYVPGSLVGVDGTENEYDAG